MRRKPADADPRSTVSRQRASCRRPGRQAAGPAGLSFAAPQSLIGRKLRALGGLVFQRWSPSRTTRRRCKSALAELGLPERGVDIHTLREHLETQRGRRIELVPVAGARSAHGIWLSKQKVELVQYERYTSPWHQCYIVCHEFGHMILGHDAGAAMSAEDRAALLPDVPVDPFWDVDVILRREVYGSVQEQEAEYLATMLMQRIDRAATLPQAPTGSSGAALARLVQSLGDAS